MAKVIKDRKNKVEWKGERTEKRNVEENAVEYCERLYPETTSEFQKILDEMYETFCKKQRNYGPGNISVGTNLESDEDGYDFKWHIKKLTENTEFKGSQWIDKEVGYLHIDDCLISFEERTNH